jgi:hypothetical protein
MVTRFFHAPTWAELRANPDSILPDFGQAIIAFGWLAAFLVVCIPALVKLLPRLPLRPNERASRNITNYLREFMTPESWPFGRNPNTQEIEALAARFAANSFWPTGNNRASQLFLFAIWVGLIVFFTPPIDNRLLLILTLGVMGIAAFIGQRLIFWLMSSSLRYIDSRLVDLPHGEVMRLNLPGKKMQDGVFLSYRRIDSSAYTGRLYDYLVDHFYQDQIFIDVERIPGGDEFSVVLNHALDGSAAVIVVIGPRWLNADDGKGGRRLDSPDDWVRMEVSSSLKRSDVKVFPVLVGGATLPKADDLPDDMKALVGRNAREVSDTRWDYDAKKLMNDIRSALEEKRRSE